MKLDFVWLGVMGRLGTDVSEFQEVIIDEEDFTPEYVGFYELFFTRLNKLLYENLQLKK